MASVPTMALYQSIQPVLDELATQRGHLSPDRMAKLFSKLQKAVAESPACTPILLLGYNGFYFESPFNSIRNDRYEVRKVSGMELAQTLMDCIYIQQFPCERVSYIRGVMPVLTRNMTLSPAIEHEIKMSYVDGEVQVAIQFAEDKEYYNQAVLKDGGMVLSLEMPTEGSAPRHLGNTD